ncbi:hypothetical protein PHLGIDRAFT_119964 [Phlebiopsis gigantea 11061_1 CR5-6]|uniref:Uncharacterized protein n=1 Tax=Phlebiopsis gigantea (strain 11061_1 CR5-6) TaxID=745531 RepID=A0A0C3S506_PHLG1|nr:hypothetical protein PHLGIDRAFT_119964 [Phlebiopsis gigantea 11061_1 CR5-6]
MSSSATSQPFSGYASPASSISPLPHAPKPAVHHLKSKPVNVFSNDGSFLERFQHLKKDEEDKKKQEETMAKKRAFDSRFKQRGKRPLPLAESSDDTTEIAPKKLKVDEPTTQYQREVSNYAGRSLKDNGNGVRPLVK